MTKNPFANQFTEAMNQLNGFSAPNVDFNQVFAIGRRNIEALTAAHQAITEGAQTAAQRSAEQLQKNIEQAVELAREVYSSKSPEASSQKQIKFLTDSLETSMAQAQEVYELLSKSGAEASDTLSKRANECISECNDIASSFAQQSKKAAKTTTKAAA